jgi:acetyl-CoA carboxylase biotin carboxyl carrier protein
MGSKKQIVDKEAIRELAKLMDETGLTEIEIADDDSHIRVARTVSMAATAAVTAPVAAPLAPEPAAASETPPENASRAGALLSPMVGTAFHAAEPGGRPFVEVGDTVQKGQTLLIVEAMKTMNQIPATRAGKVMEILVEDGQPVEYDEPLLIIE